MTHLLPAHLLRLFTPRPQLKYVEPADHSLEERRTATISGLAEYMDLLKEDDAGPTEWTESPLERSDRLKDEAREKRRKHLTEDFEKDYKPKEDPNVGDYDPFKTLFVYRLSYRCTTKDLEDCFQRFGSLDRVKIPLGKGVDDKKKAHKGRPRGYAFVVFRNESDMREAYRRAQGLVIHGRAIAVDVVRAGTQQGWKPRRYNGGLGGRQVGGPPKPMGGFKPPMGPGRGGFRGGRGGGFRGGFRGDAPSGPRGYGGGGGGYGGRNSNYEPVGQSRGGGGGGGYGGGGGRYEDRPRYDDRRRDDRPRYDDRRRDDRPRW